MACFAFCLAPAKVRALFMNLMQLEHRSSWSRLILIVLIAVTVGLLLALVWIDLTWRAFANAAKERDLRVRELQGEIVHFDEVLTMSALMAATTGDESWRRRYETYEPLLGQALQETTLIVPHYGVAATKQTKEANRKLFALEAEAFALVEQGRAQDAQALLLSPEYAQQKAIYSAGMRALDQTLEDYIANSDADTLRTGQRHLILNLGVVILVTLGWAIFFRNMIRTEDALVDSHQNLTRLADELADANQTLETRAAELAHANSELGETNLNLSNEIETRIEAEAIQKELHHQLLAATRQAGMAEIATGVLHNVGNALNSVNVSATLAHDLVLHSHVTDLERAVDLLIQHDNDLEHFLTATPRGQLLLPYLTKLTGSLLDEHSRLKEYLADLEKNVDHTKQIVKSQQTYAKISIVDIEYDLGEVLHDVLKPLSGSLTTNGIELVWEGEKQLLVHGDKHKVIQILNNLTTNAVHALIASPLEPKRLIVRMSSDGENMACVDIQDTGVGIDATHLTKIFQYGFTTKESGHGFGLHHSALVAREMGGELRMHSVGVGHGACFTLELPLVRDPENSKLEFVAAI